VIPNPASRAQRGTSEHVWLRFESRPAHVLPSEARRKLPGGFELRETSGASLAIEFESRPAHAVTDLTGERSDGETRRGPVLASDRNTCFGRSPVVQYVTHSSCPRCGYWLAPRVGLDVRGGNVVEQFECHECGREWADQIL
jgi:hypothetical protein